MFGPMSLGLYGFLIAYLSAPVTGIPLESTQIVELVQGVPEWLKISAKSIIALPFTFHSINGVRHLAWDLAKGLNDHFMPYVFDLNRNSCCRRY